MKKTILLACILSVILFVGVAFVLSKQYGWFQPSIAPGSQRVFTTPGTAPGEPVPYIIEEVATSLRVPWGMAFTSPSRLLVTERLGRIRVIQNGILRESPIYTVKDVATGGEEGLMGIAIDPEYERNTFVYIAYAYERSSNMFVKVVRLTDRIDSLTDETVIIDTIPAAQFHAGCRIRFGPDKKLYITTGDATDRTIAQDLSSLGGKILRINSDGSIPSDNPFPDSPVWSYGHRNPQGLAWHPDTYELFASEHGPSGFDGPGGGDEINHIIRGGNYGWPLVSHEQTKDGTQKPLIVFTPAEAPASLLIYSGTVFPQFKNNVLFGALRGEGIMRLVLSGTSSYTIASFEKLDVRVGRVRDIIEGPDGYIYFSTSNHDERGKPAPTDDRIFVMKPKPLQ